MRKILAKLGLDGMVLDSGITFALRLTAAVIAYANFVLLARLLQPADLGHFVFAQSSLWLVTGFATLGLGFAAMRFIPSAIARGRMGEASNYIAFSRKAVLIGATLLAAFGCAWLWLNSSQTTPIRSTLLLIVCIGIPFAAMTALDNGISRAFKWFVFASTVGIMLRPAALFLVLVFLIAVSEGSNSPVNIAWILVIILAGVSVLQALLLRTRLRRLALPPTQRPYPREWLTTGVLMLFATIYSSYALDLHVVVSGFYLGPEELAVFNAVLRTVAILGFASAAVGMAVSPRAAALHAQGNMDKLNRLARKSVLLTALASLAAVIVLIAVGELVLGFFGDAFVVGYPVLLIAAVGQVCLSISTTMLPLVAMTGHQTALAWGTALLTPVIIAVHAISVPEFGLLGASYAFVVAAVSWTFWVYWLARQRVGIRLFSNNVTKLSD